MARRGHERGVLRGERREEKEREKALGGREAGGGRAGEFYQPQRLLARLWRRLHGKKEGKISDGFASLELPECTPDATRDAPQTDPSPFYAYRVVKKIGFD